MRFFPALCIAALLSHAAVSQLRQPPPPPDPCKVMSQQEASALFGAPLGPAGGMVVGCMYLGPGGDDKKGIVVTVVTAASMGGMNLSSMYDALMQKKPGDVVEPVAGMGEKALMVTSKDSSGTTINLEVLYHDKILGIAASNSPNPNIREALKAKVKELAGRV